MKIAIIITMIKIKIILKEENEILKKELKESNDQINLLKHKMEELKENSNPNISYNINKNRKSSRNIMFAPNLWDKKNMKCDLSENVNNGNGNKKEFSFYGVNGRMKFKKNISVNNNNINKHKKKLTNIKKNFNIEKKNHKRSQEELNSCCLLDKPCDKIPEYISKVKI